MEINNEIVQRLVDHVNESIYRADRNLSKIRVEKIYKLMSGMNSSRVRHLINNICSLKDSKLLDLGTFRGAIAISAAWENDVKVYAVDLYNYDPYEAKPVNTKEPWPNVLKDLRERIELFKLNDSIEVVVENIYKLNKKIIPEPINICYYDASPLPEDIKRSVKAVTPLLDKYCIFICSNTQDRNIINAFEEAFVDNEVVAHWSTELRSRVKHDQNTWWDGIRVWIVETPGSFRDIKTDIQKENEKLREERLNKKKEEDK